MKHSPFKNAEREGPSSPVMARRVLDTQPGFSFGETNHFASSASEPLPAFSLSQQPGQQGGSSLFVSEPVPVAEKPASTQGLAALKARVLCKSYESVLAALDTNLSQLSSSPTISQRQPPARCF